jgi:hypothetical protein
MSNFTEPRIDSSRLTGKFLKRFKKVEGKSISSYSRALNSLKDKKLLPYTPLARVTPFVVVKMRRMEGGLYRQTYYAFTYLDVDDFSKFSIYPSIEFLEKFPHYAAAMFVHELAHVIAFRGTLEVTREKILKELATPMKAEEQKELDVEETLQLFEEPLRSVAIEWDGVSKNKDFKDLLLERSWTVNANQFESHMFQEKRKRLDEFLTKSGRKGLGLDV